MIDALLGRGSVRLDEAKALAAEDRGWHGLSYVLKIDKRHTHQDRRIIALPVRRRTGDVGFVSQIEFWQAAPTRA